MLASMPANLPLNEMSIEEKLEAIEAIWADLEVLSKVVYEKQAHPRLNWASLTCKLMVRWGQNAPLRSRSNPP